jgi:hypothetical protein
MLESGDPALESALDQRRQSGHMRAVLSIVRGDGSSFMADITSTLFLQDGQQRACVVVRDVTETEELIDRQAELVGDLYLGISSLKSAHRVAMKQRPQD